MFDWFKQYPEEEWYDIFTELIPNYLDDTQRKSWFEDPILCTGPMSKVLLLLTYTNHANPQL